MTPPTAGITPATPSAPGSPALFRRMDGPPSRSGMGADGVLYEFGDGAAVDAVVYCTFAFVGCGRYDVFAGVFAWVHDEEPGRIKEKKRACVNTSR